MFRQFQKDTSQYLLYAQMHKFQTYDYVGQKLKEYTRSLSLMDTFIDFSG